jgi:hypothetical protein
MHTARSAQHTALVGLAAFVVSVAASAQGPGPVQFPTEFSTHDYTSTSNATTFHEMWADVKTPGSTMPGEGRTYSVGTIEIHEATESPSLSQFSFRDVELPPSPARPFIIQSGMTFQTKQVAILQVSGRDPDPQGYHGPNDDQDIRWQRYFYGDSDVLNNFRDPDPTQQGPIGRKATNARAISVFPVMNADGTQNHKETRIAICGETYDSELPKSQITQSFPTADYSAFLHPQQFCRGWAKVHGKGALNVSTAYPFGLPSGFIAVYNGDGDFLWSHQFFFQEPDGFCAITDVSIRVERRPETQTPNGLRDVVTYCGFSSFGVRPTIPNETSSLTPLNWFSTVVPNPNHATVPALGDTDHGLGQWDGIVGRISNVHVPEGGTPTTGDLTVREFHAIVGGIEQDALWGLAELPDNRFVVVGETANVSGTSATVTVGGQPVVRPTFPFTWSLDLSMITNYCLGTVTVFDATDTLTGGSLVLEASAWLGSVEKHTVCRDIAVQLGDMVWQPGVSSHRLAVVGTTDDAQLFSSLQVSMPGVPVLAFGASAYETNGFLATGFSTTSAPGNGLVAFLSGSFQGTSDSSSWSGVANWNEYVDHLTVCGQEPSNAQDLALTSFLVDTAASSDALQVVRRGVVPASPREEPSKLGFMNAMPMPGTATGGAPPTFPELGTSRFPGHAWDNFDLGEPTGGGGVAVDERGRVCVVGATDNSTSSDYPVLGAVSPIARAAYGGWDGVRTVCDMLPLTVGRSDGTGEQNHATGTIPPVPSGYTGSTTPTCALLPFGSQLGMASAPLQRMLIDWEGPDPGPTPGYGTNPPPPAVHFLFIDRIPATSFWLGTVVQFSVPTSPAGLSIGGIENWVSAGQLLPVLMPPGSGSRSFRYPLLLPPATGVTFSAQVLMTLTSNLSAATFEPLVSPAGTATCAVAPWQVVATPAIVFSY